MNLPQLQPQMQNPFPPLYDDSNKLGAFLQGLPIYLRKNIGEICDSHSQSYSHHICLSDGESVTFIGKNVAARMHFPGIAPGYYLLSEQTIRKVSCWIKSRVPDINAVIPDLHTLYAEGKMCVMTSEQANEICKFVQYGKDNHNFSNYVFEPAGIYSTVAPSFNLPMPTGLSATLCVDTIKQIFTQMLPHPQFLVTQQMADSNNIHNGLVVWAGLSLQEFVLAGGLVGHL